jgi:flagellar basal body-associated protein FliL
MAGVQFYDVVAGGHRTALTRTQIAGLFQAGQLTRNDPCKAAEQTQWRTVDEVFPLLKEGTLARSLYQPTQLHKPRPHVLALTAVISVLVIAAASLVAYFFWLNGTPGPRKTITATAATNPQAPVAYTMENPYFVSRKARAEEERYNAAQKARSQAQAAKLAQERAEAERKEQELQKAAGKTLADQRSHSTPVPASASRKARK